MNAPPGGVSWSHPPANAPRIERNFRDLSCLAIAFGEETLWQESNCAFVAWYPASTGRRNGTITFHVSNPPISCSVDRDHCGVRPQGKRGEGKEPLEILLSCPYASTFVSSFVTLTVCSRIHLFINSLCDMKRWHSKLL